MLGVRKVTGFIVCVDIVGSTEAFYKDKESKAGSHQALHAYLCTLVKPVQDAGGLLLSFRGDGYLAAVHHRGLGDDVVKVWKGLQVVIRGLNEACKKKDSPALRTAIHYGRAVGLSDGPLANQFMGKDVFFSCRLCDKCGDLVKVNSGMTIVAVEQTLDELAKVGVKPTKKRLGSNPHLLKGFGKHDIFQLAVDAFAAPAYSLTR